MALSQLQLEAFQEAAREGSFTKAAAKLNLTQSALSHRIKNLEFELKEALFLRLGNGLALTEAGAKLLAYCQVLEQAEGEFLQDLSAKNTDGLFGTVRFGGTSTLMRSRVMPALSALLRAHRHIRVELATRELVELPRLLKNGQVDFLVTTGRLEMDGVIEENFGEEENVLIESARYPTPDDIYLDHDIEDQTTYNFLKHNGKRNPRLKRFFLDDIYGILDGVAEGWGRAVAPLHMIAGRKDLRIIKSFNPMVLPIYVYWQRQPFYTKLHQKVQHELLATEKK